VKQKPKNRLTTATKDALYARTKGRCDYCGLPMDRNGFDAHHRLQKSLRGHNGLSNLVGLHRLCHDRVHKQNNYLTGFLLHSWEHPENVTIQLFDGMYLLDNEGGMLPFAV
jgi:5-methylcytosine-specific restriction endonuclease McrA